MHARLRYRLLPLIVSLPFLASPSTAAEEKPLSFGVPSDVHFFVRGVANPDRDALDAQYVAAFVRLWDSGVLWDVVDLALTEASREEAEQVRAIVERVLEVLGRVEWAKLFEKEFAFAYRLAMGPPEYVFLFRVPEAAIEAYRAQLRGLLEDVASFAPEVMQVRDAEGSGGVRSSLVVQGAPGNLGLYLGTTQDAIVLTTSQSLLGSSTRLLRDGSGEGSIAKAPAFRRGIEHLGAAPAEAEWYFDLGGMCDFASGMIGMVSMGAPPDARPIVEVVSAFVGEVSVLRSVVGVERTKGNRTVADTVLLVEDGSDDRCFPKLLGMGRTLQGFEQAVPREASSFYASAGCDPAGAYDALVTAIRENTLEGEGLLQQWEGIQQQFGFHLRDDLLAHLSGESTSVAFPGEGGRTEWVWRIGLTDGAAVSTAVRGGLEKAMAFLRSRGQDAALDAVDGGLLEVRLGAFPGFRPVVGVSGNQLVLACSSEAAKKTSQVAKGAGILENPRFRGLDLGLDGPVGAVYYANVEGQLEGFAQVVSALGFFASLLPEDRETRPALRVGAILTKLGRFLREIDLELDRGGFSRTLPGGAGMHYRTVTTHRRAL